MDDLSQLSGRRFALGHAAADTWQEAARAVAEQLGDRDDDELGFVYVTDHLSEHLGDIASFLAGATGTLNWCGTIGIGICATGVEYFDRPAVVAMTCSFPGSNHALFTSLDEAITSYAEMGSAPGGAFCVVHGDPRREELMGDVPRLARDTDGFLVGALTSSRASFGQLAGRPADSSLAGLLMTNARVATGLTQGCTPLGGYHQVTQARENLVIALDGKPAMDVFVETLSEAGISDLRELSGALHVALPVTGSDMGDYLVRNLVGLDPDEGTIMIGDNVQEVTRSCSASAIRRQPRLTFGACSTISRHALCVPSGGSISAASPGAPACSAKRAVSSRSSKRFWVIFRLSDFSATARFRLTGSMPIPACSRFSPHPMRRSEGLARYSVLITLSG